MDVGTTVGIFLVGASAGTLLEHVRISTFARGTGPGALIKLTAGQPVRVSAYVYAVATTAFSLALVLAIPPLQRHGFFSLFHVIVALIAYLYGFRPALLALGTSTAAIDHFLLPSHLAWPFAIDDVFRMSSFILAGIIISAFIAHARSSLATETKRIGSVAQPQRIARQHARFRLNARVTIHNAIHGLVPGNGCDISESGICVALPIDLRVGDSVELTVVLPTARIQTSAIVRNKTVFRYGFQFVEPSVTVLQTIRDSCAMLERIG